MSVGRRIKTDGDAVISIDYESVLLDDENKKAVLFRINGKSHWLPRSQIEYEDGKITMPEWLAMNHGLI